MQHAIPYRTWVPGRVDPSPPARHPVDEPVSASDLAVQVTVSENAVVVFGRRGCCMCHVLRRLLLGHGVNPPVFEVDEEREAAVVEELSKINGVADEEVGNSGGSSSSSSSSNNNNKVQFPVVFVGGKVFGGLERVMATHISGELVPILRKAGALWL
ncbi:Thioredoxin-like fold containing protein [Parasponia andersonii]|uniref:Thioredoxin-like fold containing protein n=1 Tax=Parasponia andersonii TaxID=3476 RepID=A0A2P5BCZ2_PARAD|nr:Thioredoxin-like fold containing protein [Parasponia andersonii]